MQSWLASGVFYCRCAGGRPITVAQPPSAREASRARLERAAAFAGAADRRGPEPGGHQERGAPIRWWHIRRGGGGGLRRVATRIKPWIGRCVLGRRWCGVGPLHGYAPAAVVPGRARGDFRRDGGTRPGRHVVGGAVRRGDHARVGRVGHPEAVTTGVLSRPQQTVDLAPFGPGAASRRSPTGTPAAGLP